MPIKPRLLAAVVLLLAVAEARAAAPAAQPEKAAQASAVLPPVESKAVEKDGLSITVSMQQRALPADEQPQLVLRFKNTSGDYINLYDVEAFWNWHIELANTDKLAVDPGPWRVRFDTLPDRSHPIAHRQVKPGESTEVVINLNDPPFTFNYVYEGIEKHLVAPVRFLRPGTYRVTVKVALQHPFGPGYHEWTGPATTEAVEFTISRTGAHGLGNPPTKEELAAYDAAINRVTSKLDPNGLWMNGRVPDIKLPADAKAEEIVAAAVNTHSLGSKAYRMLRVRPLDRPDGMSAALVEVGGKPRALVFLRDGRDSWWTRFYDTELLPPTTRPFQSPR